MYSRYPWSLTHLIMKINSFVCTTFLPELTGRVGSSGSTIEPWVGTEFSVPGGRLLARTPPFSTLRLAASLFAGANFNNTEKQLHHGSTSSLYSKNPITAWSSQCKISPLRTVNQLDVYRLEQGFSAYAISGGTLQATIPPYLAIYIT